MVIELGKLFRIVLVLAATCTWYGPNCTDGNPYTASFWHRECLSAPAKVDYRYFGVATRDRSIPFCTKIRLTVLQVPSWAREKYSDLIGNSVVVTVVDRLADEDGQVDFDLWPAAAKALMGSNYHKIGVVYVRAEILKGIPQWNHNKLQRR
jgi:hypothetical protein